MEPEALIVEAECFRGGAKHVLVEVPIVRGHTVFPGEDELGASLRTQLDQNTELTEPARLL